MPDAHHDALPAPLPPDLVADLAGVSYTTDPETVRRASRDMSAVLSPALARTFATRVAQAVAAPRDEAEVLQILAAAAHHRVPLIPRGAGTCNFGQSVPLRGGIVLDLRALAGLVDHQPGSWRAWTGTLMHDLDAALAPTGEEMRIFPSSKRLGTVGGYVNGGHAGIGAIRHGVLADHGNISGLRVLTVEETPQVLELDVDDSQLVHFSFGTAGVVTQVSMPTTHSWAWRDVAYTFPTLAAAADFGYDCLLADGVDVKNVHPVDAGIAAALTPLALPAGRAAAICMVAPHSAVALASIARRHGGEQHLDVAHGEGPRRIPFYEYTWGHAFWWLRKGVPEAATLMALLPEADPVATMTTLAERFGGEHWIGVSCKRFGGRAVLQIGMCVRTEADLLRAGTIAVELGCAVADTHRPVLSASSIYEFGQRQQDFKARVDPYGLLNPGKIADVDADDSDVALSSGLAASGFTSRR